MKLGVKSLMVAGIAVAMSGASAANAAVRYDFTATSSYPAGNDSAQYSGSFSYTSATFITPNFNAPAADLNSCTVVASTGVSSICTDQGFLTGFFPGMDTISFSFMNPNYNGGIFYYFTSGSFSAAGTYSSQLFGSSQAGQLVVTDLSATPSVPEPATWAMMLVGFGMIGFAARRRSSVKTTVAYA